MDTSSAAEAAKSTPPGSGTEREVGRRLLTESEDRVLGAFALYTWRKPEAADSELLGRLSAEGWLVAQVSRAKLSLWADLDVSHVSRAKGRLADLGVVIAEERTRDDGDTEYTVRWGWRDESGREVWAIDEAVKAMGGRDTVFAALAGIEGRFRRVPKRSKAQRDEARAAVREALREALREAWAGARPCPRDGEVREAEAPSVRVTAPQPSQLTPAPKPKPSISPEAQAVIDHGRALGLPWSERDSQWAEAWMREWRSNDRDPLKMIDALVACQPLIEAAIKRGSGYHPSLRWLVDPQCGEGYGVRVAATVSAYPRMGAVAGGLQLFLCEDLTFEVAADILGRDAAELQREWLTHGAENPSDAEPRSEYPEDEEEPEAPSGEVLAPAAPETVRSPEPDPAQDEEQPAEDPILPQAIEAADQEPEPIAANDDAPPADTSFDLDAIMAIDLREAERQVRQDLGELTRDVSIVGSHMGTC